MPELKEASFYEKKESGIQCQLCPHFCFLAENSIGKCGVRKNISGKLRSLVYGKPCSVAVDPIEKKPLFHFAPGSMTISISTMGCNLSCLHCQNWEISQYPKLYHKIVGEDIPPKELFDSAVKSETAGMSWTYTEPTLFFEYFFDTAMFDIKRKFYQVWVTNGFTNVPVVREASRLLDAANVDYKGDDKFYQEICSARLEPVLEAMKEYRKLGVWIEIANLLIPGKNDSKDQILEMVKWIKENLGSETPLHFSAYYPAYKMNIPATPTAIIEKAIKIADDYLDYVYAGNISSDRESTFCPKCKTLLIKREGFHVSEFILEKKGKDFFCPKCSHKIPIAGTKWIPKILTS